MAKTIKPLTDKQIEKAKPGAGNAPDRKDEKERKGDGSYQLFDGGGLFLLVTPSGGKLWRLKYRFGGKPCLLSLGKYPEVSLADARQLREDARKKIAAGINPSDDRKQKKAALTLIKEIEGNTLEKVARQWFEIAKTDWTEGHAVTVLSRMERDIFPPLGKRLMSEITSRDVLAALRLVEARQAYESAHRIKTIISQIFTYAIIADIPGVQVNPAAGLSKALKQPYKKSMSAIIDPDMLARLLINIDNYGGSFVVRCALKLAPLLFVRPGELRNAKWQDIDLDGSTWRLPIEDMKLTIKEKARRRGQIHTVPLSAQAVEVLRELYKFTGSGVFVFPGRAASRVMSENTVNQALRIMGYDSETVTGHGFRATARTMLHERLGFTPDAIEAQLGHAVPDRLGTAYNRTKHIEERRRMMQAWSDYLDGLKNVQNKG
ncbi:MAG: tyrosine-type recombinase/integrase [Geobacter sp.]